MQVGRAHGGDLIWLPLSVHVCLGLVVEYWPFVGACMYTRYIATLNHIASYYLCLLCLSFYVVTLILSCACILD